MVYLSFITAVPLFFFDLDHRVTWLLKILVLNRKSFRPSPPIFWSGLEVVAYPPEQLRISV